MKLILVSNNLVLENIIYNTDLDIEQKRINRPLSIEGEKLASKLSQAFEVQAIYSSDYASALASAKYISQKINMPIYIDTNLRDSKIGSLNRHNIQMLRYMQERDFNYKFSGGESLNETKIRMKKVINKIIRENQKDVIIFTHKRAILSYLLDYTEQGFNLDDRLILSKDGSVILDDADKEMEIIVLDINEERIKEIKALDIEALV